jgi:hypothetical protein
VRPELIKADACDSVPPHPVPASTIEPAGATPSVKERTDSMLDVHPPHEAIHTRKGFILHIATITIGLLIAIGLEQTVEYFHHRSVMRETREALAEEKQENIRRFRENIARHVMMMGYLHNNLRIFEYLREHPGTPQEKLPGVLYWTIGALEPLETAWSTAQQTNSLILLPRAEVNALTEMYAKLEYSWHIYQPLFNAMARGADYFTRTADVSTISPAEINIEIDRIMGIQAMEAVYGDTLSWVGRLPDFGPVPDYWQMLPFYHMHEYYQWVAAHPEVAAQSDADLDAAKAHAGLPAETPDIRSMLLHK